MPSFFQEFVSKLNALNIDNLTEEELAEFLKFLSFSRKMRKNHAYIYLSFNRLGQGESREKELTVSASEAAPFRIALVASYFKDNQEAGNIFLQKIENIIKKIEKLEKDFGRRNKFLPGIREHSYLYELLSYQEAMNFVNKVRYSFDPEKYSDIFSMMSFLKTLDSSPEVIVEHFRLERTPASLHMLSLLENLEESYEDEKINEILQTDLQKKYNSYAFGEAILMNTLRSSFKKVGRTLFNKGVQREYQIDFIQKVFKFLKGSNFDTEKKATYAYVILLKVQKEVEEEHNVFPSGMNQLCVQLKKELKGALPFKKVDRLENDKAEYTNTLKEALKEIASKRMESRSKH